MLDVLDKELEKRGHRFVRYADDCNIYVGSERAGERVTAGIEQFLARRLKLKINKAKSAVAKPSVRKFLGFSFTGGNKPRRRIAPQAIARFKSRVRELTRRSGGQSLSQVAKELSVYLVGWRAYFGFCETPSVLRALDQWIRRRLRAIAPGSSGSMDADAFASCDTAVSARPSRRKPPAAHEAHGGSAIAKRSSSPCRMTSSERSAWRPHSLPC